MKFIKALFSISKEKKFNIQKFAIDTSLKITAVKPGAKSRSLKIDIDKTGELFLPTTADLSGYEIQIKRGSKVLKRVVID